jgi:hypothetical protein
VRRLQIVKSVLSSAKGLNKRRPDIPPPAAVRVGPSLAASLIRVILSRTQHPRPAPWPGEPEHSGCHMAVGDIPPVAVTATARRRFQPSALQAAGKACGRIGPGGSACQPRPCSGAAALHQNHSISPAAASRNHWQGPTAGLTRIPISTARPGVTPTSAAHAGRLHSESQSCRTRNRPARRFRPNPPPKTWAGQNGGLETAVGRESLTLTKPGRPRIVPAEALAPRAYADAAFGPQRLCSDSA